MTRPRGTSLGRISSETSCRRNTAEGARNHVRVECAYISVFPTARSVSRGLWTPFINPGCEEVTKALICPRASPPAFLLGKRQSDACALATNQRRRCPPLNGRRSPLSELLALLNQALYPSLCQSLEGHFQKVIRYSYRYFQIKVAKLPLQLPLQKVISYGYL